MRLKTNSAAAPILAVEIKDRFGAGVTAIAADVRCLCARRLSADCYLGMPWFGLSQLVGNTVHVGLKFCP